MKSTTELYRKYEQIMQIMLEEHDPLEVAAVLTTQGLSIYKTCLDEDDYDRMILNIVSKKDNVKRLV